MSNNNGLSPAEIGGLIGAVIFVILITVLCNKYNPGFCDSERQREKRRIKKEVDKRLREIEEQNRINEMERRSSSSDSSISEPVLGEPNQTAVQDDFDPPAYKDVSIPMAGNAFENRGFQSTDDL